MSPHTRRQYARLVERFTGYARSHPGADPADQVRAWLATLTPPMGRLGHQALRAAYGPQLPWHEIPKPRAPRNTARLIRTMLAPAEREQLRDSLTSPRDWALLELFWTLRRAEAARAYWRDVDLGAGIIQVPKGKGGKASWTLLPDTAQVALAEWFRASGEPPDDSPIFPSPRGQPITPGTVSNMVRRLLKRAGLHRPGRGAHAFRRTFATEWMRSNRKDLLGLKEAMRHASVKTTELYVYLLPEDLAPSLARVKL